MTERTRLFASFLLFSLIVVVATSASAQNRSGPGTDVRSRPAFAPDKMETILYGVAYYPEYMPYDRLDKDVELMQKAGITVVRVGESTWSSWEPRDGDFQFAWMQRILDRLHAAGIKAILGTPTYSIPYLALQGTSRNCRDPQRHGASAQRSLFSFVSLVATAGLLRAPTEL